MIITAMSAPVSIGDGCARLAHLGVIRARGADAKRFLHSQLTSDMLTLGSERARWAGFCSAKGRLQASFLVLAPADDDVLLVCSADLLPATVKRLSMFVLRLQCKLGDATAEWAVWGAIGSAAASGASGSAMAVTRDAARLRIEMRDAAGSARALWLAPAGEAPPGPALGADAWRWLDVRSGQPWIEAATVDQFVPQMLNLELLGGVDFQKGCYPGQEVVARSQYRGTIKRRMFLFDSDAPLRAGEEVFSDDDPQQPAGMVVNAAPAPAGGWSALVEIKLAALDAPGCRTAAGASLRRAAMPYTVPLSEAA